MAPSDPPASAAAAPPTPPQQQQQQPPPPHDQQRPPEDAILHNVALGVTPIALGAMFLPPRKFDLRLIILGGVALWGTNRLVYDYTGKSSFGRFSARLEKMAGSELPEQAQRTQMLIRQEKERRAAAAAGVEADKSRVDGLSNKQPGGGESDGSKGALEAIWMGDAGADWKEKRAQKEKEALQEGGGGVWGLIMDHFSDVHGSGKQKRAEVLAVREQKQKEEEEQKHEQQQEQEKK